jgi:hypothetical protein
MDQIKCTYKKSISFNISPNITEDFSIDKINTKDELENLTEGLQNFTSHLENFIYKPDSKFNQLKARRDWVKDFVDSQLVYTKENREEKYFLITQIEIQAHIESWFIILMEVQKL